MKIISLVLCTFSIFLPVMKSFDGTHPTSIKLVKVPHLEYSMVAHTVTAIGTQNVQIFARDNNLPTAVGQGFINGITYSLDDFPVGMFIFFLDENDYIHHTARAIVAEKKQNRIIIKPANQWSWKKK